ncbi:MAG TPA: DUF692 family protein [Planctomycetota bacterium]|jgi:hypothetical protein|nr:DUF692 family protein [Planctomycetota bacterium]
MGGAKLSIGAFYNPHLGEATLAAEGLLDHLAMADPPRADDPWFPRMRERFALLLHDFLGQLSEPVEGSALERARSLLALYRSPWAAEHLQRVHTSDGARFVDYVFPPLYTEDLLGDYVRNARALREALGVPLAVEPIPTYLRLPVEQLEEADFLRRFYAESGCDFLLDVAHEWLSARFAGRSPRAFLEALPLEAVTEIHVAGTVPDPELGEPWIGAEVPGEEILDLAELVADRAPRLRAVTFDAFSTSLRAETLVEGVRRIRERFGSRA